MEQEELDLIDEFDGDSIATREPKTASTATTTIKYPSFVPGPSRPQPSAEEEKKPQSVISSITRRWKDVLLQAGLSVEFAWHFAIALEKAGFDESNALQLTDEHLAQTIHVQNPQERQRILDTIQHIAVTEYGVPPVDVSPQLAHASTTWRNLFRKAKLTEFWGTETSNKYITLLAGEGWDDWNAEDLSETSLEIAGITEPLHREVILHAVERELAEAELYPGHQDHVLSPMITEQQKQELKERREELDRQLEAYDEFHKKLAKILSGDTERQREARAQREKNRALRAQERERKHQERLEKRMLQ